MRRAYALLAGLSLTTLAAAAGCLDGAALPTEEAAQAPIIGGILDPAHTYVVGVGDSGGVFCTGTVISRRTVITAGHCYGGISRVYFGQNGQTAATVVQEVRHPGYSNNTLANDLAILKLGADSPVQPAPLLRETMSNNGDFVGPPFTFVGYGDDGNGGFGKRRVVTFPIDAVGPANVGGTPGSIDATQFYYQLANKNTCQGDSGGPAFAVRGGVERHAGTTSFGDGPCKFDGVQARTDLPAISGFIQARIDQFEGASNACRANGVCDESCNTDGQVWDPDCQENHCAADGLCALACVAPVDPDCTGASRCGAEGACDLTCPTPDPDCAVLCPGGMCTGGGGAADAGVPPVMVDAGGPPLPPDAAPPLPPDASLPGEPDAGAGGEPDAGGGGGDGDGDDSAGDGSDGGDDASGGCGCRSGGARGGAGDLALVLLAVGAVLLRARRRTRACP